MTQCEQIVDYINTFGSITTMDAFMDLGITRLASRIADLKAAGYRITSETVKSKNRFNKPVHFNRYSLEKE